jgi:NADPH:quinone reductase-like Zn-dependent oxidoreductase
MRAIAITEFGGRDKLKLMDLPKPEIGPDEVLIAVKAAGVNPVDWKVREGWLQHMLPYEFPLVLGWEAAGVVAAVGARVASCAAGDEVYAYCRKPVLKDGAYAEYLAVAAGHVALKPRNMSFTEAATVPLAALTAYQSLIGTAGLREGETVLIHAAAGGVGSFAVQIAKSRGATVLGTAGSRNQHFLRALGTDSPIDYTRTDFRAATRELYPAGVDVVFDCVGGETLRQSVEVLKPDGRLVSIVDAQTIGELARGGTNASYVFVAPNGEQLAALSAMIERYVLRTHLGATFRLEHAAQAHEQSESHHTRGKMALTF